MYKVLPFLIAAAFVFTPSFALGFSPPPVSDSHEIAKKDKSYKKYYKKNYNYRNRYPSYQYRYNRPYYPRSYYYYNPYDRYPYYDSYYYYNERPRSGLYFRISI